MLISNLFNPVKTRCHGIVKHTQEFDCVFDYCVGPGLEVSYICIFKFVFKYFFCLCICIGTQFCLYKVLCVIVCFLDI